jgi:hypothetical protein
MIRRIMNKCMEYSNAADRETYLDCIKPFESAGDQGEVPTDAIFRRIFKAQTNTLFHHAMGNAACPPDLLAGYVDAYLRMDKKPSYCGMRAIAANPALPIETMRKLTAYLLQKDDSDIMKGVEKNPAFPRDLLAALAVGAKHESDRDLATKSLWLLHGVAEEEIPGVPPANLDGVSWLDAP